MQQRSVRCDDSKSMGTDARNFFNTPFFIFATRRALHFHSQENFFAEIENKIHFFLVAFAADF
jgi:hypothetical protein